jgi:hypothetical protein
MRRLFPTLGLLGTLLLLGCSDDDATGPSADAEGGGLRDLDRDPATGGDASPSDAGDAGDDAAGDLAELDGAVADRGDDAAEDAAGDAAADVAPLPGPAAPLVECLTNADCPAGEEAEVCCTNPNTYTSTCVAESRCSGGARDACLTDAQCGARRPGEWTVCCHDRGDRSYCAPVAETCQPLLPCEEAADCSGELVDVCCSHHPYYRASYCTSAFFANNPATECPP